MKLALQDADNATRLIYLQSKAWECERKAERERDPEARNQWFRIASAWSTMHLLTAERYMLEQYVPEEARLPGSFLFETRDC